MTWVQNVFDELIWIQKRFNLDYIHNFIVYTLHLGNNGINKSCHLNRSGFHWVTFPHGGGGQLSPHQSDHRGFWQLSISVCELRTDLFRIYAHTRSDSLSLPPSLLLSYKSARNSRNISPILRETYPCSNGLHSVSKFPPHSLMKSGEKGGLAQWVPQSPPLLVAWGSNLVDRETPALQNTIYGIIRMGVKLWTPAHKHSDDRTINY